MKKIRFYYLAVAVMTAMCLIACNDNDEEGGKENEESAIATPKYAEQACKFVLDEPVLMSDGRKLSSIEMTESGRIYVELKDNRNRIAYYSDSYRYNNGVYTCAGKHIKGTVTEVLTRAGERTSIKVNLTVILDSGTLTMETTADVALAVMKVVSDKHGDSDIISTWKPRAVVIDIDGVFKEFPGGDLDNIRKEAEAQGVELNEEDRKVLKKVVEYVTVSTNMLSIDYTDGTSDVADWDWVNSIYDKIDLKLKDAGMGNKFIVDDPSVNVEFSKPQGYMNLTISATITDSKKHEAAMTLRLEQVREAK
ncbi:MAG: hypothetical protein J5869_06445 [Bacteroidaceae bacterium]|nr:hypothetical protein [Bacteroidaceae bacterium]